MNEPQEQALVQEILADAQRRAERIQQRADREARKLLADAAKEAQSQREALLAQAREKAEHQEQRMTSRIDQELQALRRQALYSIVQRVRDEAQRQLADLAAGDDHRDILAALAVLAIGDMTGDGFLLVLRPQDAERWRDELPEVVQARVRDELSRDVRVAIAQETVEATGGLIVRDDAGRQMADQTFEGRMRRLWEQIDGELVNYADWAELAPWLRSAEGGSE